MYIQRLIEMIFSLEKSGQSVPYTSVTRQHTDWPHGHGPDLSGWPWFAGGEPRLGHFFHHSWCYIRKALKEQTTHQLGVCWSINFFPRRILSKFKLFHYRYIEIRSVRSLFYIFCTNYGCCWKYQFFPPGIPSFPNLKYKFFFLAGFYLNPNCSTIGIQILV